MAKKTEEFIFWDEYKKGKRPYEKAEEIFMKIYWVWFWIICGIFLAGAFGLWLIDYPEPINVSFWGIP